MSGAGLTCLDSGTSAREVGAALARDGAVIVEGLLGPDLLARFNAELDPLVGLPRRAQELLGWGAHDALTAGGGYLGTVDLRDPVELQAEGEL